MLNYLQLGEYFFIIICNSISADWKLIVCSNHFSAVFCNKQALCTITLTEN